MNNIHIVAYEKMTRGIGYKNSLLFKLEKDLLHFRQTTLNHIVLMGRKTYESIGNRLPRRINIILSRDKNYQAQGCHIFDDVTEALSWCQEQYPDKSVFVIGGAEIYRLTLPFTHTVIATEIESQQDHKTITADTFYPILPRHEFYLYQTEPNEIDIDQISKTVTTFRIKQFKRKTDLHGEQKDVSEKTADHVL
jgi:dihydrofolate reductase